MYGCKTSDTAVVEDDEEDEDNVHAGQHQQQPASNQQLPKFE